MSVPRVVIKTLGAYSVHVDGVQVTPRGKAGELLRAVVGLGGADTLVHQSRLSSTLWPDSEGPAARSALDTTLHRLRRAIGIEGAVALKDAHVSLSGQLCAIDASAFEQGARAVLSGTGATDPKNSAAVTAYHGGFLHDYVDETWLAPRRDALHARFLRVVSELGRRCETSGEFRGALDLYERALDVDALHEPLHQGVIRCLHALGRRVETLRAFDRCKKQLHLAFECSPSSETCVLAGL